MVPLFTSLWAVVEPETKDAKLRERRLPKRTRIIKLTTATTKKKKKKTKKKGTHLNHGEYERILALGLWRVQGITYGSRSLAAAGLQ